MLLMIIFQIMGNKGTLSGALGKIYDKVITPDDYKADKYIMMNLSSPFEALANISKMIGGIGALFYISYRIWKQYASGEPISIFPLLRPFVLGLCILFFKQIVITTNAILYQFIKITEAINRDDFELDNTLISEDEQKFKDMKGENDDGTWTAIPRRYLPEKITKRAWDHAEKFPGIVTNKMHAQLQEEYYRKTKRSLYFDEKRRQVKEGLEGSNSESGKLVVMPECDYTDYKWTQVGKKIECFFKNALKWIVEGILYLVILFMNMYRLLALSILFMIGPLAFGISIFDGFQNSLTSWITRYVNIYLWLPVANIVATLLKIMAVIINSTYSGNFWYLLLFGIMCIFLFFKIPQMTSWIVSPGMEAGGFMDQAAGGATKDMIGKVGQVGKTAAGKGAGVAAKAGKGILKKMLSKGKDGK